MAPRWLKIIAFPLGLLAFFVVLYAIWILLDLPPEETILRTARDLFERYGVVIVLVSAFLEGLLLIGWYFPGTLVIILGLILAGADLLRLAQVGVLAATGLFAAYVVNFLIGRHGWYRLLLAFGLKEPLENAQRRLTRHGLSAIFMTYWQPNLSSLVSTAAGILQFPFGRFVAYSLPATALWITFWSLLIYFLGRAALSLAGFRFIFIALVVWIVLRLLLYWMKRRR
jgi:membrane protein DedA with SNARE-associated domain